MKVNKVGELPIEQSIEIKSYDEDSQLNISNNSNLVNRKYIIEGSVILLTLIGMALYFFVIKDNNGENTLSTQNSAEYDKLKLKELELKERELIFKEKEMKLKNTPDESSLINEYSIKINGEINKISIPREEAISLKENFKKAIVKAKKKLKSNLKDWEIYEIIIVHPISYKDYIFIH